MKTDNLLIVESPAKAKTIAAYLNQNTELLQTYGPFRVMSSLGHVFDLEKKNLGIDVDHDFTPRYTIDAKKNKLIQELRKAKKESARVWLASDYDREGEAIAMHLKKALDLRRPMEDHFRITFTEITPSALERAIRNPRDIDRNLVDAQEARRVLDRLVGFSISPLLWKRFSIDSKSMLGLSAGRVQSAVLHMIIEKEDEIARGTQDKNYWHVLGDFHLLGQDAQGVHLYEDQTIKTLSTARQTQEFLEGLQGAFSLLDVVKTVSRKNADPPYITSSLQQDAYNKLGFSMKKTMKHAQELYEQGYITYMRTDSYHMNDGFKSQVRQYVGDKYGEEFVAQHPTKKASGGKNGGAVKAQEAHEAIRPTRARLAPEQMPGSVTKDQRALYDIIWRRALASQMAACVSNERKLKIVDRSFTDGRHYFLCTCSRIAFPGFLKIYGVEAHNDAEFTRDIDAPPSSSKRQEDVTWQKLTARHTWSSPPARYNESSMVRALEKEGIGRPSTYASILTKLFDKQYVIKNDIPGKECRAEHYVRVPSSGASVQKQIATVTVGQEKNKLVPTSIGRMIDAFLREQFDYIIDKTFTAHMEQDLDRIAQAETHRLAILSAFWKKLDGDVKRVSAHVTTTPKIKCAQEKTVLRDDTDGVQYTLRNAKYGPVIAYEEKKTPRYIPLKGYLSTTGKKDIYREIDVQDIRLLRSMPKYIGSLEERKAWMAYGPYGFYVRLTRAHDEESKPEFLSLPPDVVTRFLESGRLPGVEDVRRAMEYKKMRPTGPPARKFSSKRKSTKKTT